jgi:hypothetical protein
MARWTARKLASKSMSTAKEAAIASPTKPNDTTIGSSIRATDTPNRFMMWPVTTIWSTSVTTCVRRSMFAKIAVRASVSSAAAATIARRVKYKNVPMTVISST